MQHTQCNTCLKDTTVQQKKKENNNNQDPFKDTKKLYMFMGPHKHRRYSLL